MDLPEDFSIDGWCQPHTEVTAAAGLAFGAAGRDWLADAQAAWRYVLGRQLDDGSWRSYWWVDDLYPTAQAVALAQTVHSGEGARDASIRAAAWAAARQSGDGSWTSTQNGGQAGAFQSALGVIVLASARGFDERLRHGLRALTSQQEEDGGWASGPVLQIPPPHVVEPADVARWREEELGTGVVISDRARLYTTATAVIALCLARR
jgi:squalene cyclase